jgi:predicted naringenin-chalcone synthase
MFSSTFISRFRALEPAFILTQDQTIEWLAAAHTRAELTATEQLGGTFDEQAFRERIGRALCRHGCDSSRIASRGLQLEDCTHTGWSDMSLYRLAELPRGEAMLTRTRLFGELAATALDQLYPNGDSPPQDLLHVTCTGYAAPSAAQTLIAKRGWGTVSRVTHAYHMGCYASIPALHIAAGFIAAGCRRGNLVNIVHTELCSLHLNPSVHTPEQLVIQTLFADGVIGYSVTNEVSPGDEADLQLLALEQDTIPDSGEAMQWI